MHEYTIKRSNRRTVSLEITKDMEILVRAPLKMPESEIGRFVESHEKWIDRNMDRVRARQKAYEEPNPEEVERLRKIAAEYLPEAVRHYSAIMGVTPSAVKITSAKTRFGSCSSKNSICFSWRLMQYPKAAIDYVVVHELAHIVHKNHGKLFYQSIEEVMPDYKERKELLKSLP